MPSRSPFRTATGLLFALIASAGSPAQAGAQQSREILVVVSPANPVDKLTVDQVRRIFLREETAWPNGSPITVFERPANHPARAAFGSGVLGQDQLQLAGYWLNLQFTRGIEPPKICPTPTLLKQYFERLKGGIGYVYEEDLIDGLKVVTRVTQRNR